MDDAGLSRHVQDEVRVPLMLEEETTETPTTEKEEAEAAPRGGLLLLRQRRRLSAAGPATLPWKTPELLGRQQR